MFTDRWKNRVTTDGQQADRQADRMIKYCLTTTETAFLMCELKITEIQNLINK